MTGALLGTTAMADDIVDGRDANRPVRIDVVSDAICPWCYIGKRHLDGARALLEPEGLSFAVYWRPFQLNPDMPREGVERAAYRAAKFGSAVRAAELDARVAEAGAAAALTFRLDLMQRTPNTLDAHRLIRFAESRGAQDAVVEALFAAYFTEGRDIGDPVVLADCARMSGLDVGDVAAMLAGEAEREPVLREERAARQAGVNGVPSFFIEGHFLLSGAVPAQSLAEALRRAVGLLREHRAHASAA
jgi:predicted DsbA family dithiol-disulfide isomerase